MNKQILSLNEIRTKFLDYFAKNNHSRVRSSPLVPHNDPTLMFTNSGMVQFKNVFTGLESRDYNRATSSQRCIRAGGKHNDLENVGYTARHHTFFEMLGNFSFGDYFKEQAIFYAWEFLTKELGFPKDKLYVTIYHTDDEAYNHWKKIAGLPDDRIIRIKTSDNFWSMGDTGPCGPCSEIFYDHGDHIFGGLPGTKDEDGDRYIEIWNMVFMQYEQIDKDTRIDLPQQSIDTGMGLERLSAVLQNAHDNYDTDLFKSLIAASESVSSTKSDGEHKFAHRIIADHLRSSAFLIADGVMPSNDGRGYVLRRIMRRAMCRAHLLGMRDPMMHLLVPELVNLMGDAYPELVRARDVVVETLRSEEERFKTTLERGLKLLDSELTTDIKTLPGEVAFKLYDTFGFPLDLTESILRPKDIAVDILGFDKNMQLQKEKARAAWSGTGASKTDKLWFELHDKYSATEFLGYNLTTSEGVVLELIQDGNLVDKITKSGTEFMLMSNQTPFYGESGGQMGDIGFITGDNDLKIKVKDTGKYVGALNIHNCVLESGSVSKDLNIVLEIDQEYRNNLRKHHSATHILHSVLREVLGSHVTQKGSLVAHDKLRFDIAHNHQITKEQITKIEHLVNKLIMKNSKSTTRLMSVDDAIEEGAMALFGEKYDEEVRVVKIGDESVELCGGTHVDATGDIGLFKITSESAIAAGVRRIEAVCGFAALEYLQRTENLVSSVSDKLNAPSCDLLEKADLLVADKKNLEKKLFEAKTKLASVSSEDYNSGFDLKDAKLVYKFFNDLDRKIMRESAMHAANKYDNLVAIYCSNNDGKLSFIVSVSTAITSSFSASNIANDLSKTFGGKGGGGKPNLAQSGGIYSSGMENNLNKIAELCE